ncbi:MAG TPA: hypothetical protein VIV40_27115 [Kofleriaceae bacterium]
MISKTKLLASALIVALTTAGMGCAPDSNDRVDRWATTENTNVKIDFDKVNEAYRTANGPEDFEKRVNEIYEGDELISVAVHDQDDKTQIVTGFFDKNQNGAVDDSEKIFTIKREPTGDNAAQYQTTGYGPYAGYHSPFFSIVSGMIVGSMISNMFAPRYVPYAYTTSRSRLSDLGSHRSSYRAANPTRFGPASRSGRNYGSRVTKPSSTGRSWGRPSGGRSMGGGRFGLARRGRTVRPERLTA